MNLDEYVLTDAELLDLVQYVAEELRGDKLSPIDAESILAEWLEL